MQSTTKPNTTTEEREAVRDQFVWVFNTLQDRVGLYANPVDHDSKSLWFEERPDNHKTRELQPADVKVTVKYSNNPSNNEVAHLGTIDGRRTFKLGIHFTKWRRMQPEKRLEMLVHEAGHARYPNHDPAYWKFVFDMWEQLFEHKQTVEEWAASIHTPAERRRQLLQTPIDWEQLKAEMVDDVHDNAEKDRQRLLDDIETRLDYKYEFVRGLDWPYKLGGTKHNPATNEWEAEPTEIELSKIVFSKRYDDATLYERFGEVPAVTNRVVSTPVIRGVRHEDGSVEIVENELDAALFARLRPGTLPVVIG